MTHTLLTGATGLLGGYLLRDALLANHPIAVLVRRTTSRTARQRIDAVLSYWEKERNLPRPVILTGDISQPLMGLNPLEQQWVAENCSRVLHSAASIAFYREPESDEPYRSNVIGTQHVLHACRTLGLREMHYVSTAYICGTRSGKVFEHELDTAQTPGNDYESSKIAAEKLIRNASWLNSTVYRPSIIIGDSVTGYTTTFHGYYTPLQVAWWLSQGSSLKNGLNSWFLQQLGLQGHECKNVVPVDWVSSVIWQLMQQPTAQGKTFHLTNPHPPTVMDLAEAMGDVIRPRLEKRNGKTTTTAPVEVEAADFQKHMQTYRAYFRDDPSFDQTEYNKHLPQFPCPHVDRPMLAHTGGYAVDSNFGWPKPLPPKMSVNLSQFMEAWPRVKEPKADCWLLQVTGCGGGTYTILATSDTACLIQEGYPARNSGILRIRSDVFAALLQEMVTLEDSLRTGRAYMAASAENAARMSQAVTRWVEEFRRFQQQNLTLVNTR